MTGIPVAPKQAMSYSLQGWYCSIRIYLTVTEVTFVLD